MKILLKEYNMVRSCTNKNCNNYRSGALINGKPEVADVLSIFGEPEQCDRCGVGLLVVKRASFINAAKIREKPISKEFRFLVKCTKCDKTWTTTRITPLNFTDIGAIEFLKTSSVDKLRCPVCKQNDDMVLLQASEL
jgi:hypothetical protein